MANKKFIVDIDLSNNQLKHFKVDIVDELPVSPSKGRLVYYNPENKLAYFNGDNWIYLINLVAGNGITIDDNVISTNLTPESYKLVAALPDPSEVSDQNKEKIYIVPEKLDDGTDTFAQYILVRNPLSPSGYSWTKVGQSVPEYPTDAYSLPRIKITSGLSEEALTQAREDNLKIFNNPDRYGTVVYIRDLSRSTIIELSQRITGTIPNYYKFTGYSIINNDDNLGIYSYNISLDTGDVYPIDNSDDTFVLASHLKENFYTKLEVNALVERISSSEFNDILDIL